MPIATRRKAAKPKVPVTPDDFENTEKFQEHLAKLSEGWASVIRCYSCKQVVMIVIKDFTDIVGDYNEWDSDSKAVWCARCKPQEIL